MTALGIKKQRNINTFDTSGGEVNRLATAAELEEIARFVTRRINSWKECGQIIKDVTISFKKCINRKKYLEHEMSRR